MSDEIFGANLGMPFLQHFDVGVEIDCEGFLFADLKFRKVLGRRLSFWVCLFGHLN
jgi:hypothetical protein